MHAICSYSCVVTLTRSAILRGLNIFLIFGSISYAIIHSLSTEYINIWYACSSIDTKYGAG